MAKQKFSINFWSIASALWVCASVLVLMLRIGVLMLVLQKLSWSRNWIYLWTILIPLIQKVMSFPARSDPLTDLATLVSIRSAIGLKLCFPLEHLRHGNAFLRCICGKEHEKDYKKAFAWMPHFGLSHFIKYEIVPVAVARRPTYVPAENHYSLHNNSR